MLYHHFIANVGPAVRERGEVGILIFKDTAADAYVTDYKRQPKIFSDRGGKNDHEQNA